MMLKEYKRVLAKIPAVIKPLMSPHLTKLDVALEPGVCMLTWTSLNLSAFLDHVYETLGEVDLMIDRVNDIIEFRIEKVLEDIANSTDGAYQDGNDTSLVLEFVSEQLKAMDKKEFEAKKFVSYKDRFQAFLFGALFFLLIDLLLFETKTKWIQKMNLFNENEN